MKPTGRTDELVFVPESQGKTRLPKALNKKHVPL